MASSDAPNVEVPILNTSKDRLTQFIARYTIACGVVFSVIPLIVYGIKLLNIQYNPNFNLIIHIIYIGCSGGLRRRIIQHFRILTALCAK